MTERSGRQLDSSRSKFAQSKEIVDAVGNKVDMICNGSIRRGTHILKAVSLGATTCSGGAYLYSLAAAGQPGAESAPSLLCDEIE